MTKKLISWVLVGVFGFAWWWCGFEWSYLEGWDRVYVLFTLLTLVQLQLSPRPAAAGLLKADVGAIKSLGFNVLYLIVAVLVGMTLYSILERAFVLDSYIHGIVMAIAVGLTTSLWYGAIEN